MEFTAYLEIDEKEIEFKVTINYDDSDKDSTPEITSLTTHETEYQEYLADSSIIEQAEDYLKDNYLSYRDDEEWASAEFDAESQYDMMYEDYYSNAA